MEEEGLQRRVDVFEAGHAVAAHEVGSGRLGGLHLSVGWGKVGFR